MRRGTTGSARRAREPFRAPEPHRSRMAPRRAGCAPRRQPAPAARAPGPGRTLNLADHVADDHEAVVRNRARLRNELALPQEPRWLVQRHGARVMEADAGEDGAPADGIVTRASGIVCAVLAADCVPVLLCDRDATMVAALHAGWRGIVAGIVEAGVRAAGVSPSRLLAWLGPAIGPERYEVGPDVRDAILASDPDGGRRVPTGRIAGPVAGGPGADRPPAARAVRRRRGARWRYLHGERSRALLLVSARRGDGPDGDSHLARLRCSSSSPPQRALRPEASSASWSIGCLSCSRSNGRGDRPETPPPAAPRTA